MCGPALLNTCTAACPPSIVRSTRQLDTLSFPCLAPACQIGPGHVQPCTFTLTLPDASLVTASRASTCRAACRACWAAAGMLARVPQVRGMSCSSLLKTSANLCAGQPQLACWQRLRTDLDGECWHPGEQSFRGWCRQHATLEPLQAWGPYKMSKAALGFPQALQVSSRA